MQWIGFCLQSLARQKPVILGSIIHCPPPLQLPAGPLWACTADDEGGYQLPGQAAIQLRQAAQQLLADSSKTRELSIPLNPWAGQDDGRHQLRLYLRPLAAADLPQLMLLDGKLRIGQSCAWQLDTLALRDLEPTGHSLAPQARHSEGLNCSFTQSPAHITLFGAGALAHQIASHLADTPHTVHWEANASERQLDRHPANTLLREPHNDDLSWIPDNSHCLVMSHDHATDFRLAAALATLPQVRSVGVVGSQRKRQRLLQHLDQAALSAAQRGKIRCPIGGDNTGNLSTAALAVAHEVSQLAMTTPSN